MAQYIRFEMTPQLGRKTSIWTVVTVSEGTRLGEIRWYGRWRQYTFFPDDGTVYSAGCLQDIAEFIENAMKVRRRPRAVPAKTTGLGDAIMRYGGTGPVKRALLAVQRPRAVPATTTGLSGYLVVSKERGRPCST